MSPEVSVKAEVLKGMKEIEAITGMLGTLKKDLKDKEGLLVRMEEALQKSEDRLQKKVSEIDDKESKLNEVEKICMKRQEELQIQENELQTNAIIEFLSFQAREMEIQKKMENIKELDEVKEYERKIEELNIRIIDKEKELEAFKAQIQSDSIPEAEPIHMDEGAPYDIKKLNKNLEEMKIKLSKKEVELLKKEEDLRNREHEFVKSGTEEDSKVLSVIQERENLFRKMEEDVKKKQNEINELSQELREKEKRINNQESDLKIKEELISLKEQRESAGLGGSDVIKIRAELEKEYEARTKLIQDSSREKLNKLIKETETLHARNEDLEVMGDQLSADKLRLTLLEKELKERMQEISYSEERLARRQNLMLRERKQIDEEIKKMKSMKDGSRAVELNEDLANRQKQLREIEMKLREKEEYIRNKERELRNVESKMIDQEINLEMELQDQSKLDRMRTGVRRFDDLCFGGFPFNSNFIMLGPAYSGRRTFTNLFIGEGLKRGIPALYIVTQSTPKELKENLRTIIPRVDAYEDKGLLKFIDLYSKPMGIKGEVPNTIYIEKPTDLDAIEQAIGTVQEEFKKKYRYHKIVFFSLSTLLTYIEPLSIFRFFQVLNAKNKRNGAVSVYVVDTGMHDPSVIQTLKHVMTGFIEFKLEDLKYFLRLEGGGDVMSRAWIEYSFTDKTFDLRGSFSLDHIR